MPDQTVARYEVHFSGDTSEIDKSVGHVAQVLNQATASAASSGKGLGAALSSVFAGVSQGLRAGVAEAQAYAKANDVTIGTTGQLKLALAGLAAGLAATVGAHLAAKHASEQHAAALGKLAEGHGGLMARLEGLRQGLEGVGRSAEASGQSMGFWATTLASGFGMQIDRAIQSVKALGQQALGTVVEFEKTQATMASLIGKEWVDAGKFENMQAAMGDAKEAAKELLAWTQKLAIESPFEEKDVSATLRIAQAYGFAATQFRTVQEAQKAGVVTAQRLTEATLNWAAATGRSGDAMQTVAFVSGQISKSGRLLGQDMMQLANVGLSIESAIAKSMGKSTAEIAQMREKGLIPSTVAMKALIEELETYGASAKEQANSLGGLLASLTDLQKIASRSVAAPFFDNFRAGLANLITILQSEDFVAALGDIGKRMGETFKGAAVGMAVFGDALKGTVVSLGKGDIGGVFDALLGSLTKNIPVVEQAFGKVKDSVAGLYKTAAENGPDIGGILAGGLGDLDEVLVSGLSDAEARVAEFGGKVHDDLAGALDPSWATPLQVAATVVAEALTYAKTIVAGFMEGLRVGQERFGPLLAGLTGLGEEATHLVNVLMPTRETLVQVGTAAGTLAALLYGVLAGAIQLVGKYWETLVIHFGAGVVIGAVVAILTTLAATLASLLGPMELLGAAVALFVEAWLNDWGGIRDITLVVVGTIASVLQLLGEIISAAIPYVVTLAQFVGGVLVAAFQVAGQVVLWIAEHFKVLVTIIGAIVAAVGGVGLIGVITTAIAVFQGLLGVIASAGGILSALGTVFGVIAAAINLPIIVIGLLIAAVVGLVLAWSQNLGNIQEHTQQVFGGIRIFLQTLGADIGAFGSALKTAFTRGPAAAFEQFNADLAANRANHSAQMDQLATDTEIAMQRNAVAVQGFAGENAEAQSGIQGAAQQTGAVIKAVMSGDLEEAKRLASGAMSGISGVFGEHFAGIRTDAWNTAEQVRAAMALAQSARGAAALHERSGDVVDEINQSTVQWADAQQAARKAEESARKAGQYFGGAGGAFDKGIQDSVKAGKGGAGKKAAETVAEQIKEAAEVIRSVTDTVQKLKDFLASGPLADLRSDTKSDEIIQVATWLIDMGKRMVQVFQAAAQGWKEDGNKAASALADAISSVTKAVGDVVSLLLKFAELFKSDQWPDMRDNLPAIFDLAKELLDYGLALAQVLVPASEGMSKEAAESAKAMADAIGSAASAVSAIVGLLPKLWEFVNSPAFDEIMAARARLVKIAGLLILWGVSVAKLFVKAASITKEQAEAAKFLAETISAATGALNQLIDLLPKLLDFSKWQAGLDMLSGAGKAAILKVASRLIELGKLIALEFARAGSGLKDKTVAGAKALSEAIGAAAQGLNTLIDLLPRLWQFGRWSTGFLILTSDKVRADIVEIAARISSLGKLVAEVFGKAGDDLSGYALSGSKALADGVKLAAEGLSATMDLATRLLNFAEWSRGWRILVSSDIQAEIVAIAGTLSRLARSVLDQFEVAGHDLSSYVVAGAKILTEGIGAAAQGLLAIAELAPRLLENALSHQGWRIMSDPGLQAIIVDHARRLTELAGVILHQVAGVVDAWRGPDIVNQTKKLAESIGQAAQGLLTAADLPSRLLSNALSHQGWLIMSDPGLQAIIVDHARRLTELAGTILHQVGGVVDSWAGPDIVSQTKKLSDAISQAAQGLSVAMDLPARLMDNALTNRSWRIMSDPALQALIVDHARRLTELAGVILYQVAGVVESWTGPDLVGGTKMMADAVSQALQGLTAAMSLIVALYQSAFNPRIWAALSLPDTRAMLVDQAIKLAQLGKDIAFFVAAVTSVQTDQDLTGATATFSQFIQATTTGLGAVMEAVTALSRFIKTATGWSAVALSQTRADLIYAAQRLAELGRDMAIAVASALADWHASDLEGVLAQFATVIQDTLAAVGDIGDLAKILIERPKLPALVPLVTDWLKKAIGWARAVSVLAMAASKGFEVADQYGLAALAQVMGDTLGVLEKVKTAATILIERPKLPALVPLVTDWLKKAIGWARAVATLAMAVANQFATTEAYGLAEVAKAIGDTLSVLGSVKKAAAYLTERPDLPPLTDDLKLWLQDAVRWAKGVAGEAITGAGVFALAEDYGLGQLVTAIGDALSVLGSVKDAAEYLTEKPDLPPLTDDLKAWLQDAVGWAKGVAGEAIAAVGAFALAEDYGLGQLGTAIGDALSVLDSVKDAVEYLTERPDLPPLTDELKLWLQDAVRWAKDVASQAIAAVGAFALAEDYGLGQLGTAIGDMLSVLGGVRDLVDYLADPPFLPIPRQDITDWLEYCARWAAYVTQYAIAGAAGFALAEDYGLGQLGTAIGDMLGVLGGVRDLVDYLADPPFLPIPRQDITDWLEYCARWAAYVTQYAIAGAAGFALAEDYGLGKLGTAIGDMLSVLGGVKDAVAYLAERPDLPPLTDELKLWLQDAVRWAKGVAGEAIAAVGAFALAEDYGLGKLGTAIGDALGVLNSVKDVVAYLAERPDLPPLTDELKLWLQDAVRWAKDVASQAVAAVGAFALAEDYGLGQLGTAIGDMLSVLGGVRDLVDYLADPPFLPIPTRDITDWLEYCARWAAYVTQYAIAGAAEFALAEDYGLGQLGTAIGDMLGVLGSVKDTVAYLAERPDLPPLTDDLKAWLRDAVGWAKDVAKEAIAAAGAFALAEDYGLGKLGTAIGDALGVLKDVLEFSALRSKIASYRTLDTAGLSALIGTIVDDAKMLAGLFLARVRDSGIGEVWQEAASAFKSVAGDAVGTVKDVLDLAEALFNPANLTYIPTPRQLERALDDLLNLSVTVAERFVEHVQELPQEQRDLAQEAGDAFQSVFGGLTSMLELIQGFTGIYLGMSGFTNIRETLRILFDIFDYATEHITDVQGAATLVAQLDNLLSSLLDFGRSAAGGGDADGIFYGVIDSVAALFTSLTTLAGLGGASAGEAWVAAFVSALAGIQVALPGVVVPGATAAAAATPGGTGTGTVIVQTTHQRNANISMVNQTGDAARQSLSNLYAIVNL